MYKFKIVTAANGQYRVQFLYNSVIMFWSENYTTKANAQNCIVSIKANAPIAPIVDTTIGEEASGRRFEILKSTNGEYFGRLKGSNGETLVWTETYTQKHNAKSCAEALKANALSATIEDNASSFVS